MAQRVFLIRRVMKLIGFIEEIIYKHLLMFFFALHIYVHYTAGWF